MLYVPDWQWATHEDNAGCHALPEKWTASRKVLDKHPDWNLIEVVGNDGLTATPPLVSGGNAGHQMLGLALYLYHPARIVLTGYDMQPTGGLVRWRGVHPVGVEKGGDGKFEVWRQGMATTVEPLRRMGVEVLNATRETALDCFPVVPLEEILMQSVLDVERDKYSRCYSEETYHLQGARLRRVQQDVAAIPAGATYLDVGCGRAEMVDFAASRGVDAFGLELVPALCGEFEGYRVEEGVVTAIPRADASVDFVSCYDMLEHLPEEQVEPALDELFRVFAQTLFLTTNDKQSRLHLPEGGYLELHLTRKPRAWWNEKIRARAHGARIVESTYGDDEWHWTISR